MTRAALLALALFVGACDGSDPADSSAVRLRVENASAVDFSSVVLGLPSETVSYGAVGAGRASDYRDVGAAYRYSAATVEAGGETYQVVPFDYVGETPLAPGRYTYVLGLDGRALTLTLAED